MANLSALPNDFIVSLDGSPRTTGRLHYGMKALNTLPGRLGLREKQELFLHTFSFTFVRHPFVRLLSTYKDKIVE